MNSKIIIGCVFVVCVIASVFVTKSIRSSMASTEVEDIVVGNGTVAQESSENISKSDSVVAGVVTEQENEDAAETGKVVDENPLPNTMEENKKATDKKAEEKKDKAEEKTPNKSAIIAALNKIIKQRGGAYPKNVRFHFSGLGKNEAASSFGMIFQYLKLGTWSSATVTNVDCDPVTGKVSDVYISVTHPANVSSSSDDDE